MEDLTLGNPDQACNVKASVDWFGPANFLTMDELQTEDGMPPEFGMEHNLSAWHQLSLSGSIIFMAYEFICAINHGSVP